MTSGNRTLLVHEQGGPSEEGVCNSWARLDFRFEVRRDEAEVLSAPQPGTRAVSYVVPEQWRPIGADFRQQVLNLPFAEMLTRFRPNAVRLQSLTGCTLDLPRIAALLGIPTTVVLPTVDGLPAPGSRAAAWLADSLAAAAALEYPPGESRTSAYAPYTDTAVHPYGGAPPISMPDAAGAAFEYSLYELVMRDHPLLWRMQAPYVHFFETCRQVLDLGCGAGVFLGLLESAGIQGRGVERNPGIVRYARGLGFDVREDDALEFLQQHRGGFDGIYCSHFVEHLGIDLVERLMVLLYQALEPGGRVLLVFPDPESIRSQLLGFWRDPEHVRFYHPDLVELIGRAHGFECIWHSHRDGMRHEVVPFPARPGSAILPPERPSSAPAAVCPGAVDGRWSRWLARLGLGSAARVSALEAQLADAVRRLEQLSAGHTDTRSHLRRLQADTHRLWAVNQTWAWEDNAVLCLRRPVPGEA